MIRIGQKTLEDLEFPTVLRQISKLCVTGPGSEMAISIRPFQSSEDIAPELNRVKEFTASFVGDNPIPNHGFDPISRELQLLGIENSTVDIAGFRRILSVTETTFLLSRFFKKYEEFYVYLNDYALTIVHSPAISEAIVKIIDRHGEIKDDATENLLSIRKRLFLVKGQINSSFGKALSRYAQADYLDEIRETIVENRRVLAVKSMYRRKINGAVLGSSKTGSIVYIEPQDTLDFANELSNLLYEELEEEKLILKALTEYIRPFREELGEQQKYLATIDVLYGKAKYAKQINGILPIITTEKRIFLEKAYHPLLLLTNKNRNELTYPQTIDLSPNSRIMVISGPNAGGKSITLKTVGLLQVLLQSGILIPCSPNSELGIFKRVLSDIGDNQSIENHLSTYSYRLKKMNQFLKKCDKNTLFLIDEFGTGSDPELGGALAETFLEVFYEREAFGIITTHYANLKLLANELPFAINANMQFDDKSLEPLYKLYLGEAGSSFTFEVAQKNGIPYSLINKAKKKVERGKIRFDKTIANLQKERSELRKTTQSLKLEEKKAKEEGRQLDEISARMQTKLESYQELYDDNQKLLSLGRKFDVLAEKFLNNKRKKELLDELMKLVLVENNKRKQIAPKLKKVIKTKNSELQKEVEIKVQVIRERKKKEKEIAKKVSPAKQRITLKVGDSVRMIEGRAIGTIDTIEKNKAIVNYGMFTTNVNMDELEKV